MAGFMDLFKLLQKPQSIATGTYAGLNKMLNPGADRNNALGNFDDPISGLMAGLKGDIAPGRAILALNNEEGALQHPDILTKILTGIENVGADPLMAAGPLTKGLNIAEKVPALGRFAEGASTVGKIEPAENATGLARFVSPEKVGQVGRRAYQSTLATGTPFAAPLVGVAEKGGIAARRAVEGLLARLSPGNISELGAAESVLKPGIADEALDAGTLFDPSSFLGSSKTPPVQTLSSEISPISGVIPGQMSFDSLPGLSPQNDDVANKLLGIMRGSARTSAPKAVMMDPTLGMNERELQRLIANSRRASYA